MKRNLDRFPTSCINIGYSVTDAKVDSDVTSYRILALNTTARRSSRSARKIRELLQDVHLPCYPIIPVIGF